MKNDFENHQKTEAGGFEAVRGLIQVWHQVFLKANEVLDLTQCQKFSFWRSMYTNHGHLCVAFKASSHQIVWFGDQRFAYP